MAPLIFRLQNISFWRKPTWRNLHYLRKILHLPKSKRIWTYMDISFLFFSSGVCGNERGAHRRWGGTLLIALDFYGHINMKHLKRDDRDWPLWWTPKPYYIQNSLQKTLQVDSPGHYNWLSLGGMCKRICLPSSIFDIFLFKKGKIFKWKA